MNANEKEIERLNTLLADAERENDALRKFIMLSGCGNRDCVGVLVEMSGASHRCERCEKAMELLNKGMSDE